MATYNYLSVTNLALRRFNEVELDSTTFATAGGAHAQTKDAVNSALNEIYAEQCDWPFMRERTSQTLTAYQTRYSFPATYKVADIESFRLRYISSLNVDGFPLRVLSYDEYLEKFSAQEYTPNDTLSGIPRYVFQTADLQFGVAPKPDAAYVVDYEYISQPAELELYDDVPAVPESFKYVVALGTEYYCHMFRDNLEVANAVADRFKKGIKDMRKVLINRNDYVRSSMIPQVSNIRGFYGSN